MLARTPAPPPASAPGPDELAAYAAALPAVVTAVGAELRDFAAERLKAQGERIRAWSSVRSPLDFIDIELRFAAETLGAYADEALHLQDVVRTAAEVVAPRGKG